MHPFLVAATVLLAVLATSLPSPVASQTSTTPDGLAIKQSDPDTGSRIRRRLAWSTALPLDKTYEQLTPEQKTVLHDQYEHIADGDEPPYPINGVKPIVENLVKAQAKLAVVGDLRLLVDVNAEGEPTSVVAYGSPSPQMTKVAASLLMLTKFKPARCSGRPCKMQFPFALSFEVR